jgi:sugar/nucleoside kinase (ribokinase family)
MEEHEFDLVSIGDATYDTFLTPSESESLCDINNEHCYICFTYGDKIPVKNMDFSVGGNAANNVVGCSRLGLKTAILTNIGTDLVGETILHKLHTEHADVSFITKETKGASNASTVIAYSGERTIFTFHAPHQYELPVTFPKSKWYYLTSLGENFEEYYKQVIQKIKEVNGKIAFNPGSRQLRGDTELLLSCVASSDLIYINLEEARRIVGLTESDAKIMGVRELLQHMSAMGPTHVIITDGANGSFAIENNTFYKCGVLPVDAYERTGAGDAFGSGSLAALIQGKSLKEALVWGTVNSASVIGYTGGQRGLLREGEIYDWVERAESSGVFTTSF